MGTKQDISGYLARVWTHVGCCAFCLLTLFTEAHSLISDISTAQPGSAITQSIHYNVIRSMSPSTQSGASAAELTYGRLYKYTRII